LIPSSPSSIQRPRTKALKPGGWLVIDNLNPAPDAEGKPNRPMADGRCPFSARELAAAGVETLEREGVDSEPTQALGTAHWSDRAPALLEQLSCKRAMTQVFYLIDLTSQQ
jgi:hypothetical protein